MAQNSPKTGDSLAWLKWLWLGVAGGLLLSGFVWLQIGSTLRPSPRKAAAPVEPERGPERSAGKRPPVVDEQPSNGAPQAHSPLGVRERPHQPSSAESAEADRIANQEILEFEANEEMFAERAERLSAELEAGKTAENREERLATRLTALFQTNSSIPGQVKTTCSETVCEINIIAAGSAYQFARSVGATLKHVSLEGARASGSDELTESFDPEQAIQPLPEQTTDEVRQAEPRGDGEGTVDSLPAEPGTYSVRYLLDASELPEELREEGANK